MLGEKSPNVRDTVSMLGFGSDMRKLLLACLKRMTTAPTTYYSLWPTRLRYQRRQRLLLCDRAGFTALMR